MPLFFVEPLGYMKQIKVKKGSILQTPGDLNTKVYIVESGLLRSYKIDDKGKISIFQFAQENWLIADLCLPNEPCQIFIDAIEDSWVKVYKKTPHAEMVDKQILIKRMKVMQNRIIMLMSDSAKARYEYFLQIYPDIVQRIPQKMLASFLGITPETLSRIRN